MLGIDYGRKRIGIAISDESGLLARPLAMLTKAEGRAWIDLLEPLLKEQEPVEIVIGYPRRLDGSPGTLAREVEGLAKQVEDVSRARVVLRDEALTTVEAAGKLLESGLGRRARRRKMDAAAAAVILQEYLDSRSKSGRVT